MDNPVAAPGGTEVTVRVAADHTFGPLVMFATGGPIPGTLGWPPGTRPGSRR